MHNRNNNRREFIKTTGKAALAASLSVAVLPSLASVSGCAANKILAADDLGYEQTPLPYAYNALEPAIDAMTMEIHYSKHASAYAKNLADAIKAEAVDPKKEKLLSLLGKISKYSAKMRNNGGGHYNHEFFWKSMTAPSLSNVLTSTVSNALVKSFGSIEAFKTQFADAGKNRFGSGWAWLLKTNDEKLIIGSTANQDNPLMDVSDLKGTPLLALDVWEHAYYLKYQNRRADYITAWWSVVDWSVVEKRFKSA